MAGDLPPPNDGSSAMMGAGSLPISAQPSAEGAIPQADGDAGKRSQGKDSGDNRRKRATTKPSGKKATKKRAATGDVRAAKQGGAGSKQ